MVMLAVEIKAGFRKRLKREGGPPTFDGPKTQKAPQVAGLFQLR
jgi:hypothetical protein